LSHLYIKMIILPRQARDKHREHSKKREKATGSVGFRVEFSGEYTMMSK
jgi:hypothetical protein